MKYFIYLKLSNDCNLKCNHCYNKGYICNLNINTKDIIKFLNLFYNLHKSDEIILIFHGGLPLLDKNILKIFEIIYKCKKFINFNITTNLVYLLNNKRKTILNLLKNKEISTSWDYLIRFSKLQEKLWLSNIKELQNNKFNIRTIVCLTNILIRDITPKLLFLKFLKLKIYNINFLRITNTENNINNLRPLNKKMRIWLLLAYKLWKKLYKNKFNIPLFNNVILAIYNKNLFGCKARKCQLVVLTINPDGSIAGCPNTANKTYTNIKNYNIKNNSLYCKLCNKLKIKSNLCYICKFYLYCNGDCYQLEFDNTGCPGLYLIYEYLLMNNDIKLI